MNDLISRQAAIDEINHICPVDTEYDCTLLDRVDVRCVLSDLPSARQWIPVTERLPKPNETVNHVEKHYLVQNEYGDMLVCTWDGIEWAMTYAWEIAEGIVAWMPLPEPWKGEDDETD